MPLIEFVDREVCCGDDKPILQSAVDQFNLWEKCIGDKFDINRLYYQTVNLNNNSIISSILCEYEENLK